MSARQFSKVSPAVWRSGRFIGLGDPEAQLLYLYYLSCEHQTSAGCYRIPDGYACDDLGWQRPVYLDKRAILASAELITFDPVTSEIYIDRWFQHCSAMGDKHAIGIRSKICLIDSDLIREKVEVEFEAAEAIRAASKAKPAFGANNDRLAQTGYLRGRS